MSATRSAALPSAPPRETRSLTEEAPGRLLPATDAPVLVAHRGASGYRPEHTLPAYELAARMGADYLSVDVTVTRDGQLVARHECELSATTDVASRPEHAGRRALHKVDGYLVRGWFVEHLTLEQVRALRVVERYPHLRHGSVAYNGLLAVPTLGEVLGLRRRLADQLGRPLGVLLQLRSPGHLVEQGLDPVCRLVELLRADGLDRPDAPVVVVSDDLRTLERVRGLGCRVPLHLRVQVGEHRAALRDLAASARIVTGLQPDKQLVRPRRLDGTLGAPTGLVQDAHAAGLVVIPWVFRAENAFLPEELRRGEDDSRLGRAADEIRAFLAAGVDGFCTDHTDRGVLARRAGEFD
ncbi:glycerophosphodiester phosphodiesterase family protein [Ornithinimicrobium sufpigmenti]|uniref:glycerophosphodiester phosphodiesterase family protein n=1 Tax=Ornithinimicrobium sufpigmenti TaxID=2508882 RepID=UPI0015E1A8FA|nr:MULTISPECIES: glycerophosphodiester phosphodiesterase family protein [unclassified Ornithinimicrobium]